MPTGLLKSASGTLLSISFSSLGANFSSTVGLVLYMLMLVLCVRFRSTGLLRLISCSFEFSFRNFDAISLTALFDRAVTMGELSDFSSALLAFFCFHRSSQSSCQFARQV